MSVSSHVSSPKLRSELKLQDGLCSTETRYILVDLTKPYLDLFYAVSLFNDAMLQCIQRRQMSSDIMAQCYSLFNKAVSKFI